jgi:hypothetical protein
LRSIAQRFIGRLDLGSSAEELGVLAGPALSFANGSVVGDEFDGAQVFDHLVAQLRFDAQAQRAPYGSGSGSSFIS